MACVEHQILELVALVHEDVVNAHPPEVRHIVRAVLNGVGNALQLGRKVVLAHLQPLKHGP